MAGGGRMKEPTERAAAAATTKDGRRTTHLHLESDAHISRSSDVSKRSEQKQTSGAVPAE